VRWLVEKALNVPGEKAEESDVSPGSLYSSGLIAAGANRWSAGYRGQIEETQGWLPGELDCPGEASCRHE